MKRLVAAILPILLTAASAQVLPDGTYITAPYGPGGSWNLYQARSTPMTWTEAQSLAESLTDPLGGSGKKGHLVCISGAAENAFVYTNVRGRFVWLGLTDHEKYGGKEAGEDRDGGWRWVTGEPLEFAAWRGPEPNDHETGGEDAVAMEYSCRWADWPMGSLGQARIMHPFMIEWETRSPEPVPGAKAVARVLPESWPVDLTTWQGTAIGEGPWSVVSTVGFAAKGLESEVARLVETLKKPVPCYRMPRLNYHVTDEPFFAGGWAEITDHPNFPFIAGPSAALHVATIRLEKAGTWSFNVHCDDGAAVRIRDRKWKSVNGLGGIDPLDASVMFFGSESGDARMIGVVDLPAGDSAIEVVLGNRVFDGMIQLLAAPGAVTMDGGTDQWRSPGHKAAGDLAWPGMDAGGWTVTRTGREAGQPPLAKLMDGLALAESGTGTTAEGVESLNHIDSGAAADVIFPDPTEFPGGRPGGQEQFVVRATGNLVIPRDGIYHIGIHADDHCALRIVGKKWLRFVRDGGYCGKLEGDTIYGENPMWMGSNVQLLGEIELKKGIYKTEALYINFNGPSVLSVFGAPAGLSPRLLVKGGAGIEPDIAGLPLVE